MLPIIFNSLSLLDEGFKHPGIGQIHRAHKLPLMRPNLTPFRPANPVVLNLYIAGLSRNDILITQKEKNQYISEK